MDEIAILKNERAIIGLLKAGDIEGVENALMAAGGPLYAFHCGYESLTRIVEAAPEDMHLRSEPYFGALCILLVKQGRAHRARALLCDEHIQFQKSYLFEFYELLVAIHLGADLSEEKVKSWHRLEGRLPIDQPLYDGLYYNCMLVILVRLNRLSRAHTMAVLAIESYKQANQPYLVFYIHLHLADLAIVEGDIKTARRQVQLARAYLDESGKRYGNELALIEAIGLAIDFELGRYENIPQRAVMVRDALEAGGSWAEIFIQVCRIGTLSLFFVEGRRAALEYLEACQISFNRQHGEYSNTLDVIMAQINLLEGRLEQAQQNLVAAKKQGLFSAIGMVMCESVQGKIDPGEQEELTDAGNLTLRREISRQLINALVAKNEARPAAMRHHVEAAMRLAVKQGLVSIFLEHREVVAKVSGKLATGTFARGHVQLARMARQIHKLVQASYTMPRSMSELGITSQQMRVLTALQSGASNKQIARKLGVSEANVKFHLRNLFGRFDVAKRGELIEKFG